MLILETWQILFAGDGLDRSARRRCDAPPTSFAGACGRSFARAGPRPGALDDFLGTALAGLGVHRNRHRPVPAALLAWPLALASACRARRRARWFFAAPPACVR